MPVFVSVSCADAITLGTDNSFCGCTFVAILLFTFATADAVPTLDAIDCFDFCFKIAAGESMENDFVNKLGFEADEDVVCRDSSTLRDNMDKDIASSTAESINLNSSASC